MVHSRNWSMANRQLILLASSLTVLALMIVLGGGWYIQGFAERTSDRVLRASVSAIAETVAIENERITLEVPPGAFGMLEDAARDNVYYTVHTGGHTVTGYQDFPRYAPGRTAPVETEFRYDTYLGQRVRVATQARYLPRHAAPVYVEVAETLDEREALTRAMLMRLILAAALLVIMAALLIKPAIRWGLRPLTRLQEQIAQRSPQQPAARPLEMEGVPTELRGLVNTFNLLLGRLDASIKRVRDFTGDASHQMRTPLTALRTHLMLVRRLGTNHPDGASALQEVDLAARRLQKLLGQLLSLARSDDTQPLQAMAHEAIDLVQTVKAVTTEHAPRAVEKGIDITMEGAPYLPVACDQVVVSEVIGNIVDNAIQYIPPSGKVTVRCLRAETMAIVEVEDDGPGIPKDQRSLVFNRFYRLSRDKSSDGSGLGLAIVKSLANSVGAIVELAEGSSGRGLLVRVRFPLLPKA